MINPTHCELILVATSEFIFVLIYKFVDKRYTNKNYENNQIY